VLACARGAAAEAVLAVCARACDALAACPPTHTLTHQPSRMRTTYTRANTTGAAAVPARDAGGFYLARQGAVGAAAHNSVMRWLGVE
jgi:hypothetical protein